MAAIKTMLEDKTEIDNLRLENIEFEDAIEHNTKTISYLEEENDYLETQRKGCSRELWELEDKYKEKWLIKK